MFNSIKRKILALIVGILLAVTAAVMLLTYQGVKQSIDEREEQSTRSIIHLVMLNIESEYNNLVSHKSFVLETRKRQIRDLASFVTGTIEHFRKIQEKSLLTADEAKRQVLAEVMDFRYGNNDYFFIFDRNMVTLSHPDDALMGKDLSTLRDVKGTYIVREMMRIATTQKEGFHSYWWKRLNESAPSLKLSYSTFYTPWQWMIGTGVYIDDIDAEADKKLNSIIDGLRETFKKISIGETGYLFLFNGRKQMIIHPALEGKDLSTIKNPASGKPILDELIEASKTPDRPFAYLGDNPSHPGQYRFPKESYVAYFAPLDWYIVSSVDQGEMKKPARILVSRLMAALSAIFLLSVIATYFFVHWMTVPIKKLTEYAKSLPSQGFTASAEVKRTIEQLPVKHKDEVGELARTFILMGQSLEKYLENLTETTAAKEKIESELHIAHDIQMGILPKIFPPFPHRSELDIYAVLESAKEVGGDFYDFFEIDDTHLCFVIADVSGKGVPASLFMAVTKTLIKATARQGITPEEILFRVNNELSRDNDTSMFVSIFCGILDTETGEVLYANGGHNPPLIMRMNGEVAFLSGTGGLVIGACEGFAYHQERLVLSAGDSLFLYTDGVTEAMNPAEELFSEERLQKDLLDLQERTIKETITGIMEKVVVFTTGAPQSDDITIMMVEYTGKKASENEETT